MPFEAVENMGNQMFTRIGLSLIIALGTFIGANTMAVSDAQARYFDINSGRWLEDPPVKRRIDQRKVPKKFNRRTVSIKTSQAPGTVIIHTDEKFLYYVTGTNKAIRYGIGVGREGFGWNGEVSIKRKAEWPTWTPPAEMRVREREQGRELPASMKGGIENPLGARALYLFKGNRDTFLRIHGTNAPRTIGSAVSNGCVRLVNSHISDLYNRVPLNTRAVLH